MTFREKDCGDGLVEVETDIGPLKCLVCGHGQFHERNSLLNTRAASFFNVDWANKRATNYICAQCGYIFWFLPESS